MTRVIKRAGEWRLNPSTGCSHVSEHGGSMTACGLKIGKKWPSSQHQGGIDK
jgi:hypothetical protein